MGNGGHRLMLTSWDALLGRMEHSMERSGADEDRDLRQLRGLCAPASDEEPLACVDPEELSTVDDYKAFLADAVALAASRGIISTEGLAYGGSERRTREVFPFRECCG